MQLDIAVKEYMRLRNLKDRMKQVYEERVKPIKEAMELQEIEILEFLNQTGQTSANTVYGSPYKTVIKTMTVENSADFFKFVLDKNAIDLLQKKVIKEAYERYTEDGIYIPGIKVRSEAKLRVRKNNK